MPAGHAYSLLSSELVIGAEQLLQVKAGSTTPFEVLRAFVWRAVPVGVTQVQVALLRMAVAATVGPAVLADIMKVRPDDPNPDLELSTTGTGFGGGTTGTNGDVLYETGWLDGEDQWRYRPLRNERIHVPAAGIIALKFLVAPPSAVFYDFEITIREL